MRCLQSDDVLRTNLRISQLCVAKGLVIDRIQKLKSGKAVLKGRVCRASYGLEAMVLYDEKKHVGQPVTKSVDGKNYATNQIEWIIKKV